ncbi:murein biosynthesis integral membrane protein MurJ [Sanguibacter sp. A247]|uniref:murein biosynthesis integral membrane protein MurJ n=1 Tax=unclassified Sanguibacter TaxID=2645534 RepID=UPI003FD8D1AF
MTTSSHRRLSGSLVGAAALITAVTALSRVLGFVRWVAQAGTVGYDSVGTAYASANTIPNVLFEIVAGGALTGALVPLLALPLARGLRAETNRTASAALTWALAALVPLAVLVVVLAGPVARLLAPDDPATVELTATFLRIFAIQIPLYGVGVVLSGILQAQKKFFWPAFAPVLSTLVVLASYGAFALTAEGLHNDPAALPDAAIAWLAWGTSAGVAAMSLPLLVPVLRSGVSLRPTLSFPDGVAQRARRLAGAGVGALLAQQLAVVVTLRLAGTFGGTGTWPVFQYTQAVYLLPYAVLAVPLATSVFPRLAEKAGESDTHAFSALTAGTTRAVAALAGLGGVALIAAAPAVAVAFSRVGHGEEGVVLAMGPALTAMAPGLVGFSVLYLATRALYALERARSAMVAGSLAWVTAALVSFVLVQTTTVGASDAPGTLLALALSHAIGMTCGGIAALVALRRVLGPPALAGVMRTTGAVVVGGAVAAVAGRATVDAVVGAQSGLAIAIGGGALGGLVGIVILGCVLAVADRRTLRAALGRAGRGRLNA